MHWPRISKLVGNGVVPITAVVELKTVTGVVVEEAVVGTGVVEELVVGMGVVEEEVVGTGVVEEVVVGTGVVDELVVGTGVVDELVVGRGVLEGLVVVELLVFHAAHDSDAFEAFVGGGVVVGARVVVGIGTHVSEFTPHPQFLIPHVLLQYVLQ